MDVGEGIVADDKEQTPIQGTVRAIRLESARLRLRAPVLTKRLFGSDAEEFTVVRKIPRSRRRAKSRLTGNPANQPLRLASQGTSLALLVREVV